MMSDLPPIDQVWMFSLIVAVIVSALAVLVLLGPGFVREVVRDMRRVFTPAGDDGPGPTDPEALARDAEIQEVQ